MKLRAIIEARDGEFVAWIPEYPAISAHGRTKEQALQAAREAVAASLEFDVETSARPAASRTAPIQLNVNTGTLHRGRDQLNARGKTLELLVALAVEARDVSTETLCDQLYSETSFEQAYSSLKMAVYRARQVGGQELIETTPRGYCLAADAIVDIRFLPQIVRAIRERSIAEVLEERLGGIFEELVKGRPAIYESWPWFEKTERMLQRSAREIGVYIGDRALRAGKALPALDVARRLLLTDPLDEAACELAMKAHLSMGNRASALLEYRNYEGRLQARMGVEPSAALRRLIEVTGD